MEKLRQFGRHYAEAFVLAFGVITFLTTVAPMAEWVQDLSSSAFTKVDGRLVLNKAWAATLVGLALLLVINTLVCCILFVKKEHLEKIIENNSEVSRLKIAQRSLLKMIAAAERIVNHLYPARGGVPYAVDRVSMTRSIRANGDTLVRAHYVLRACTEALLCWRINIRAEAEAPQIVFIDDLKFRISDPTQKNNLLSYLVTADDPQYKQVSVFLLPKMNPGEEPREMAYEYAWPKMSQALLAKGREQFNLDLRSSEPVDKVDFCLLFDPELQEAGLNCSLVSASLGGGILSPVEAGGQKGWRYSASNVPGDFSIQLEVEAK